MINKYSKLLSVIAAVLISVLSFGQVKHPNLSNFVNPFPSKVNQNTQSLISPYNNYGAVKDLPSTKIETNKGSFYLNLEKNRVSKESVSGNFNTWFDLNAQHTFKEVSEKSDELGFTHTNYTQFYKGFPIEGSIIMVHSKKGIVNSVNGQIAEFTSIETENNISMDDAQIIAKSHLNVTNLINDYPVETLITRTPHENGFETKLAYKVRIDSYSPFVMCNIYIDAKAGNVINRVNLIAHTDAPGTAQTLYSGNQTITMDSYSGSYRLRENGRKIETYNATNATNLTTSGYTGSTDFTNTSTIWTGGPRLASFTIATVASSWWFTAFADELPELYIKIRNGANQVVYTSTYVSNSAPPLTFNNLNIILTNAPYTIEVWDYDAVGGDDFGGSYTISPIVGTQSWSGNGNNGTYLINTQPNPAMDVHWGMEKTFDFYLSVFNRNSFDGNGSIIKQYLNPPTLQSQFGKSPNNASAYPAPYNLMQYGMGDGQAMSPVVGLDVEGHEFTHMVVANNGNGGLVYQGESGALNESFSDIFGVCVEFYSAVNPDWLMGEDIMIGSPFLRSMSNPNGGQQPDTYNGQMWANPTNLQYDNGGVHINSGVQNFWFYLLSQGGTGTNDLGNAYSVTGIGITQARLIAYRNLINYLGPNATFIDAYNGSLQAAQDLYGNPSAQYTAVRKAWYAVGIGNDPNNYCSGTTTFTASTGTISDGSGSANYNNNANCKWVIAPAGATQITLNFTSFSTEANYDTVFVYNGPDETSPLLLTWWGNALPATINSTGGALCIRFSSDINTTAAGWTANYSSTGVTPTCSGGSVLSTPTGTFNDGSGNGNYGNNQLCYWMIAPPCANSVTLSFSSFNTELNYDGLIIYSDLAGTNQLAVLTGTNIPAPITSTTGEMLVVFVSDYAVSTQGFNANYTSTGSAYCSGVSTVNTADSGLITDGSGGNNYCNNMTCSWLIQPPQATSVTLNFTAFDLEAASTDGQTVYDAVEVYDGITSTAPLLGRFTGNSLPPSITSTGGNLLVRFFSDVAEVKQGFAANYSSTSNSYCTGNSNLTAPNGTFTDGSAANQYSNNSTCSWLIEPANASSITLSFSSFNTEQNYDGLIIYNGRNNSSPVLGQFSGTSIPSSVISSGGSMFIEFNSDPSVRANGWTANYTSTITSGVANADTKQNLTISPNPTNGRFSIQSGYTEPISIEIMDILGRKVLKTLTINNGSNSVNASELSKGIYLLRFQLKDTYQVERLIIN